MVKRHGKSGISAGRQQKPAKGVPDETGRRDVELSRKDAEAGSPPDVSVGGEEDAGVGLEFLVSNQDPPEASEKPRKGSAGKKRERKSKQ